MMMISPPLIDVFLGGVGRGDQINYWTDLFYIIFQILQ